MAGVERLSGIHELPGARIAERLGGAGLRVVPKEPDAHNKELAMRALYQKSQNSILLTIVATLGWASPSSADNVAVAPVGAYAEIDTRLSVSAVQILSAGTSEQKAKVIAEVRGNAKNYAPPVFYVLSKTLFDDGHRDEGAFWFYAGQLRGRFDANRCADASAGEAIAVFNEQFGTPINQYTFKDLRKLEALIIQVVQWDKTTPHEYDPHWINLSGMKAMTDSMSGKSPVTAASMSAPASQWAQIEERTRAEYLSGWKSVLAELKAGK